jgi:hypothetical protein
MRLIRSGTNELDSEMVEMVVLTLESIARITTAPTHRDSGNWLLKTLLLFLHSIMDLSPEIFTAGLRDDFTSVSDQVKSRGPRVFCQTRADALHL